MPKNLKKEAALAVSAARTATADGTLELDVSEFKQGAFYLDVTAKSGTSPTLDVKIQTQDRVSGKWFDLVSFTQATDVTTERKTVASLLGTRIRAKWTIGGTTPSFTFSVGAVVEQE